jgi:hypothetical protein
VKELLYRPSWQALRVSMLKEYQAEGGWTSFTGTRQNLNLLETYISEPDDECGMVESAIMGWTTNIEMSVRYYRVLNCLAAVRMGYSGQGEKGSSCDKIVHARREAFSSYAPVGYARDLITAESLWKWSAIAMELGTQYRNDRSSFEAVKKNLAQRRYNASRRPQGTANRSELLQYIELMESVHV